MGYAQKTYRKIALQDGLLHVHAPTNSDEAKMEAARLVSREKHDIQGDSEINDGVMAKQDTSDDDDHADTGNQDRTPNILKRDDDADAETTGTVEKQEPDQSGTGERSER